MARRQTADLPLHSTGDEVHALAGRFHDGCVSREVQLMELQAAVLFPAAFLKEGNIHFLDDCCLNI